MREVLNVKELLPVASRCGCGRAIYSVSHWPVTVMPLDQENVTQDENVIFSASIALYLTVV